MILLLSNMNPEMEIMILDGFNGGGYPRHINTGIGTQLISQDDVDECADCEDVGAGTEVYTMGYGCY